MWQVRIFWSDTYDIKQEFKIEDLDQAKIHVMKESLHGNYACIVGHRYPEAEKAYQAYWDRVQAENAKIPF